MATRLRALGLRDQPTVGTFHAVAWAQVRTWWRDQGRAAPTLLDRKGRILAALPGRSPLRPIELATEIDRREPATVAQFQHWARDVVARLRGGGTTPVLVGGSALYTRAILDRFEFPGTDEAVRARRLFAAQPGGRATQRSRLQR